MSRKVDSRSLRTGFTKEWSSNWYAESSNYADMALEDFNIRKYLERELRNAGLSSIAIERSIKTLKITISVARPGVVIGRKGTGLAKIRKELKKVTNAEIDLQIEEVKKPEGNANVISTSIAIQTERRMSPKRAINIAADKAINAGVKGVKIQAKGTLYGPNSIATTIEAKRGAMPTQTIRADISFAKATGYTRGGTIGVKVWIYNEEKIE